ncbi:D123-domain-containing protein [Leucogyrophana mollusca]|uniref:D123-domain-containing protein n=1 Tax=Leucogyrophana mollusca TaxID=85980 RepID=A0ACB8B639_9AGAM|nr:D123-domain-containing protein [Leucogyrophana mollusca]
MAPATLFPPITPDYLLSFQFSSWYPKFSHISIKSTIIRPLDQAFRDYLDSDGVFVPKGSGDLLAESSLSDDDDDDSDDASVGQQFAFPELDAHIRKAIQDYGAVFPKLNFSSPKDASWVLPASSPLKCTAPADVYLLLKSSDFISHDLSPDTVFAGCDTGIADSPTYELELVLRKWYPVDRSRELRCFVREGSLIGICQRDTNYYDFMNERQTRDTITTTVQRFWDENIKLKWEGEQDYTFDLLLTRDLSRAHILDFNPYALRTDPLLFTYEDLSSLLATSQSAPDLRIIDSPTHPVAARNAPAHQHNMVPLEALSLSNGRGIDEFADLWREEIKKSMDDESKN